MSDYIKTRTNKGKLVWTPQSITISNGPKTINIPCDAIVGFETQKIWPKIGPIPGMTKLVIRTIGGTTYRLKCQGDAIKDIVQKLAARPR